MKFLFLNSAHQWGGNEKWMYMAANILSQEHEVFLAYRCAEVGDRFEVDKFRFPFISELDIFTLFKLFCLIRKNKIDILIPTKQKDYFIAGILSKILKVKNILRLGIVRNLDNKWIFNLIYNKLCDGIIVNANIIKQVLLKSKYMNESKIKVIYNGINIDEINLKAKQKSDFSLPYSFKIVSSGELSKRKGFDFLIQAFAQFLTDNPSYRNCGLIILGDGPEFNELKNQCNKLGLSDNVLFLGFLKNPYPIIKQCDVFISTSRNEGISNALLEAMALKKPVISTMVGGTSEFINNKNGYLFNSEDINELSLLISKVLRDESERIKIANKGWKTLNDKFSLERMNTEIIDFCENV